MEGASRCLKKVLGNALLHLDELRTVLIEVEGTLNSHPLTYVYDEVGVHPLTLSHLVCGRKLTHLENFIKILPASQCMFVKETRC